MRRKSTRGNAAVCGLYGDKEHPPRRAGTEQGTDGASKEERKRERETSYTCVEPLTTPIPPRRLSCPASCQWHHRTSFVAPACLTCSINTALARGPGPSFSDTAAFSDTTAGEMSIVAGRDAGSTNRPACDTDATKARRAKLEASPVTCRKGSRYFRGRIQGTNGALLLPISGTLDTELSGEIFSNSGASMCALAAFRLPSMTQARWPAATYVGTFRISADASVFPRPTAAAVRERR